MPGSCAIILNYNRAGLAAEAARSVSDAVDHIFLVDNASEPADLRALEATAEGLRATLITVEENLGYAAGNNRGIAAALEAGFGELLILNNDATASSDAVRLLRERLAEQPELAGVAPLQLTMDGTAVIYSTIDVDRLTGSASFVHSGAVPDSVPQMPWRVDYLCGTAMLLRAQCGPFDEDFVAYYEDFEWSSRARRYGWGLEIVPRARFHHHLAASTPNLVNAFYMSRGRTLFLRKAFSRSRPAAAILSLPPALSRAIWWARRKQLRTAAASLNGWVRGVTASGPDRSRLPS